MALQVTHNRAPNAVVLVSPDGTFYTESNIHPGKVRLDDHSPKRPHRRAFLASIDLWAHAARYLNLTYDLGL